MINMIPNIFIQKDKKIFFEKWFSREDPNNNMPSRRLQIYKGHISIIPVQYPGAVVIYLSLAMDQIIC